MIRLVQKMIAREACHPVITYPIFVTQLMALVARLGGHPGVYSYQKMKARRLREKV